MVKLWVLNFFDPPPPPSRHGKTVHATHPPSVNMAKTLSYRVKTTPKLLTPPPLSMAKTPPSPALFHSCAKPLSSFCSPPPPLPIISDNSLTLREKSHSKVVFRLPLVPISNINTYTMRLKQISYNFMANSGDAKKL